MPSDVSAKGLEAKDVMRARDLEGSHSHAEDAMGVGKAGQSDIVLAAMGVDGIHWVIAELVEGPVTSRVCCATRILWLVVRGLIASTVPARPRML